jgi:hypothetical protein
MKTLEEEISALKDEIAGYVAHLHEAGISEAKWKCLSDLIKTGRETLNRLLDEKNGQSAGKFFVAYRCLGILLFFIISFLLIDILL